MLTRKMKTLNHMVIIQAVSIYSQQIILKVIQLKTKKKKKP